MEGGEGRGGGYAVCTVSSYKKGSLLCWKLERCVCVCVCKYYVPCDTRNRICFLQFCDVVEVKMIMHSMILARFD